MNILQLKKAVDNAIEYATECGVDALEDITVSLQLETDNGSIWGHESCELVYDNNGMASGCVLSASQDTEE